MGRGRAKAKQTKVARELKYRAIDTDFSSLAKELRGTDEGPGVPPAYADLIEKEPEDAHPVPPMRSTRTCVDRVSPVDGIEPWPGAAGAAWHPDLLPGFESTDIPLPEAERAAGEPVDVEMVATLVRRISDVPLRRAVLYLHGWNDYFFQSHLAEAMAALGYDFYALDLRRYGRSLRRGQLAGFVTDLDHYGEEIGAAADLIGVDHDRLLLMGHSTGGLVASLWASRNPERVTGVILNSPWLDLQGSAIFRTVGAPVIDRLGTSLPTSVIRLPDLGFYARTLHTSLGGEWDYDLELKSTPSPVRVGWLRAIRMGHQRVAAGLQLPVPVLVLASASTDFARKWHDGLRLADTVLDVEQIVDRAARLGRHVTIVRIDEGLHDLVLSLRGVRERVLDEIGRWVRAYPG